MTEFMDEDLTGARFERVSLRGAALTRARSFPETDVHRSVDDEWSFIDLTALEAA